MGNDYYKKELERISNIRQGLRDNYNTLEPTESPDDFQRECKKDLDYAPSKGQTWKSYAEALKIYKRLCEQHSIQAHINGPKGPWHTHRNQQCFMCADLNLLNVMYDTIVYMASKYPENSF